MKLMVRTFLIILGALQKKQINKILVKIKKKEDIKG